MFFSLIHRHRSCVQYTGIETSLVRHGPGAMNKNPGGATKALGECNLSRLRAQVCLVQGAKHTVASTAPGLKYRTL